MQLAGRTDCFCVVHTKRHRDQKVRTNVCVQNKYLGHLLSARERASARILYTHVQQQQRHSSPSPMCIATAHTLSTEFYVHSVNIFTREFVLKSKQ